MTTEPKAPTPMPTTDEEWRQRLSPEQYEVLRQAGTEQAFTGEFVDTDDDGMYKTHRVRDYSCMRLLRCSLVIAIAVLLAAACASVDRLETSPLATWDPGKTGGSDDAAVGAGTLEISAGCVRLIQNQKTILLVWPEPTSWNASSQVIEFVSVHDQRVALRNGDQIMVGGVTVIGGGNIGEPDIGAPPFVSPPDPSCKAEETVIVNTISLVTD